MLWQQSHVVFDTINLPGGSNNDQDIWYATPTMSQAQADEIVERSGADSRWLDVAFALAQNNQNVQGVVIVAQTDMWDAEKGAAHQAGYEPFVQNIARHATAFGQPVLMLNGDSHVDLSDNPLSASDPLNYIHARYDVPNFHRIVI